MTAITYLVPISIGLALITFIGVLWTVRTNQYGDPDGNSVWILDVDDVPLSQEEKDKIQS
ncbi:cbb3-type cytochrome oxidase assembly protein CcoS (plasmid) [Parasedimentitalea marina]|uniref:Cbb3-type cytochrome oxidase assembly protein CcoS n=1 Tax=Parasedimentitalea marina TaxID=2483033 RepID=A0A3T0N9V9_9RHOB|nr:cbb3-type cytochrome oxidase assembly protein CcoS [Parasedimentitalea marina]AZV80830.1 cbb3-type cytochrome oxidase assembly protein CcoS [Parasedimentitalea marina]